MKTADFDYELPHEFIAFYPVSNREESRLMVVWRNNQKIEHIRFFELSQILKEGDILVLNNTKVIPSRLFGKKDKGKKVEVLLTDRINACFWKAIMKNPKHNMKIEFDGGFKGKVLKDGKDEWIIAFEAALAINRAKREGKRIVAAGTTVVRTLEGALDKNGNVQPAFGYTDLFIYPGFQFQIVDILITNFHLPRSTLLMLVSAFAGRELILKAYKEAMEKEYRFLSHGDAMIII